MSTTEETITNEQIREKLWRLFDAAADCPGASVSLGHMAPKEAEDELRAWAAERLRAFKIEHHEASQYAAAFDCARVDLPHSHDITVYL